MSFAYGLDSLPTGQLTGGLLIGAVTDYLLPTRYELGLEGIRISRIGTSRFLQWETIKPADRQPDGVFLSPHSEPHRLDTFRGCFVRYPDAEASHAIRQTIQNYLDDNAF